MSVDQDHLEWLVSRRSKTQHASVRLRRLLEDYDSEIGSSNTYKDVAQATVSIAFSLWRAVFLAPATDGGFDSMLVHAKKFLSIVVADNAVGYIQDKGASNWTFYYYLFNARYRLKHISRIFPDVVSDSELDISALLDPEVGGGPVTAKRGWEFYEDAFERVIGRLAEELSRHRRDGANS